jgi:hypothetical protein
MLARRRAPSRDGRPLSVPAAFNFASNTLLRHVADEPQSPVHDQRRQLSDPMLTGELLTEVLGRMNLTNVNVPILVPDAV